MDGRAGPAMLLAVLAGCSSQPPEPAPAPGEFLYVWATDSDSVDLNFLAVVDADTTSASYGRVLTTLAIPTTGRTRGHHVEHRMPEDRHLFANDFGTGKTYIIDLEDPMSPAVADSFVAAGPLQSPHSFERLPGGNVLATFQNEGPGNDAGGGIAELTPTGETVRWHRAPAENRHVRPYSLAIAPAIDRVVTGSADMRGGGASHVLQIWRLSDLEPIASLDLPDEWGEAAEPRVLSDGSTVLVSTFGCRLLRIERLAGDDPSAALAHDFGGQGCALPVVAGDVWIQAVPAIHGLVALDVSDPRAVREIARLELADDDWPHWISLAPDGRRIVLTGYAGTRHRVLIVNLDPATGHMAVDERFASPGAIRPGISFDRPEWPHGATGPADPHGVVFSLPARPRR